MNCRKKEDVMGNKASSSKEKGDSSARGLGITSD